MLLIIRHFERRIQQHVDQMSKTSGNQHSETDIKEAGLGKGNEF